ncbi:MerR family transcriptional regulator [Nocardia iowensis]|uniref:MerR family transcriptional regulator n=1 Tax=Nocardia iowensis TaxID=204891 RepID=A0ABX8RYQ8_NOCIO|nr:MerR family transcriptional regulator [Nocardia iowensis]QXN93500.1 MerR family transcriptional regulator [Nocardia iowensis]
MRISDLSRITGASPRMLRHYENAGVLTPQRDPNGYRHYREEDVKTVHDIRCLLASGLSLSEAATLIHIACTAPQNASDQDRDDVLAQLDERTRQLDAGIERLLAEKANLRKLRSDITSAR